MQANSKVTQSYFHPIQNWPEPITEIYPNRFDPTRTPTDLNELKLTQSKLHLNSTRIRTKLDKAEHNPNWA